MARIAIFYPCDPVGFVPSGIDAFIRGILKWAPADLEYTLYGATTDVVSRPLGREIRIPGLHRESRFVPLVSVDPAARRSRIPLTVRYIWALGRYRRRNSLAAFDILDFHRPEPIALFWNDLRPKNLVLHQDMSVIRGASSDIKWRHMPWLYERIEARLFRRVEQVFCVRQSAVDRYRARFADGKIRFDFIPTWVDSDAFAGAPGTREVLRERIRMDLGVPATTRLLVFVGRLDRQKDPLLLVDAFQAACVNEPDLHLVVIGDGALREPAEQRARAGGISERVSFLGVQPPSKIAGLLQASDLFLLTSAYEGMPIAVLEALAAGLPVVSTDVGEIRLVLEDGVNGAISRARAPEAIAEAIVSALSKIGTMRGSPCTDSVRRFGPEAVLGRIYRHHRLQGSRNPRDAAP